MEETRQQTGRDIVHDLRTPLVTVKGSIETLLKHWDRLDDGQRRAFVLLASEGMGSLVDNVERFASYLRDAVPEAEVDVVREAPQVLRIPQD